MAEDKDTKTTEAKASTARNADVDPLEAAATERDERRADFNVEASLEVQRAEREALAEPAGIAPAPAENIDASGSIMEPETKSDIDVDHPAVDNNPRAGTSVRQNQIDFNDPNLGDRAAVAQRLAEQGDEGGGARRRRR